MYLEVNERSYIWEVDNQAMRAIILGEIKWKKCLNCTDGVVHAYQEYIGDAEPDREGFEAACDCCYGVGFVSV